MKKFIGILMLVFVALINTYGTDRTGAIRAGSSMLSKPMVMTVADAINENETVNFTIDNGQKYMQFQTFTVTLDNISGTTDVVCTGYGKVLSAGSWVQIGSPVTLSADGTATITAVTPIQYNYLKLALVAGAGAQHSHITAFDVRTANAFDIPANSGTLTVSRATTGAVTITAKDDDANAATTYRAGGTGALTVGAGTGTTAITSSDWAISATGVQTGMGAATFDGLVTATAGLSFASGSTVFWAKGGAPTAVATGTDTQPAAGTRYWVELDIPYNATLTGLSYLVGTVGGTDSVMVNLFDSAGALVATSKKTGVAHGNIVGTAAELQSVPFTATYAAVGGKYFAAIQFNGTTARFRSYLIPGSKFVASSASGTYDTAAASITPGTTWTVSKGPILATY
jgi:hypothetical protein